MSATLTRLQPTEDVEQLAELLAPTRHLHARLEQPNLSGFRRGIPALDLWTPSDAEMPDAVEATLSEYVDQGLSFEVCDVASLGSARLLSEVFYPLFVRHAYYPGASDFPMNETVFQRVATSDNLLTLALDQASDGRDPRIVAAALTQPCRRTPSEGYSAPELIEDGLDVVACATLDPKLADAFFFASLQMLEAQGVRQLRVRRNPWVVSEPFSEAAASYLADLRRAQRLAWESREPADYFSWSAQALSPEQGLLWLELVDETPRAQLVGALTPTLGACAERVSVLADLG